MTGNEALCINCGRSEQEVPILATRFRSKELIICSSCLPVLIHKPQQLASKIDGAEEIEPLKHSHH